MVVLALRLVSIPLYYNVRVGVYPWNGVKRKTSLSETEIKYSKKTDSDQITLFVFSPRVPGTVI